MTIPHRFVCITDDPTGLNPDINVLPMQSVRVEGWWHKLSLFKPTIGDLTGKILFMDLDVVITDNIDCFFIDEDFSIIKEWLPRRLFNSSVFLLEIGKYTHVWDNYKKALDSESRPGKTKGQIIGYSGDQDWISAQIPNPHTWPMEWVPSFKYCCQKNGPVKSEFQDNGVPVGARIVIFHGNPNPPDALIGWRNYKSTAWIANYWRE